MNSIYHLDWHVRVRMYTNMPSIVFYYINNIYTCTVGISVLGGTFLLRDVLKSESFPGDPVLIPCFLVVIREVLSGGPAWISGLDPSGSRLDDELRPATSR